MLIWIFGAIIFIQIFIILILFRIIDKKSDAIKKSRAVNEGNGEIAILNFLADVQRARSKDMDNLKSFGVNKDPQTKEDLEMLLETYLLIYSNGYLFRTMNRYCMDNISSNKILDEQGDLRNAENLKRMDRAKDAILKLITKDFQ